MISSPRMQSRPHRAIACAALALGLLAWVGLAGATAGTAPAVVPAAATKTAPATPLKRVDINAASRAQLKTLPGVGDAEADRIIAGRPYRSKADLAVHQVLPTGVYLSLRHRIIAKQAGKPPART